MVRSALLLAVAACGGSAPSTAPPAGPANHATGIVPLDHAPADALALDVRVFRWNCVITAADGTEYPDAELHVPLGRPVRLSVHDPDTDLDIEIIDTPVHAHLAHGASAELAFRVESAGHYQWKCPIQEPEGSKVPAQTTHAIVAESASDYAAYHAAMREAVNPSTREGKIALGKKTYGRICNACHTVDGTPRVGPSWAGIWGTSVTLADGTTRTVDAAYVRESVLHPSAFARPGYPPSMPSFEGYLKPAEVDALTTYIESLK